MNQFRYRTVQILISIAFIVIALRLAQFQLLEGFKHNQAVRQQVQPNINILRGEIVDRYGKVLALDLTKYSLEYNPTETKEDRSKLIYELSKITKLKNPQAIYGNSSKLLAMNLSREEAKKIRALQSKLLFVRRMRSRLYPQGTMASHIIGYVDVYGKARQGIESTYDEYLQNSAEKKLELSIDSRLQVFAEKVLEERVAKTLAERGSAIVMNVKTGEILAWATTPNFNPNKYYEASMASTKNWALVDTYQPGSIFKIITVATALDSNVIDTDYKFLDQGFIIVDKWKIKNHDYSSRTQSQQLDLKMLFANSSNPFSAHLGLKIPKDVFYKYIRRFGFGSKTGIQLTGEAKGEVLHFRDWHNSDSASTAIGHGAISVTPLQLLTAVNIVASNGQLVKPTILKIHKTENQNKPRKKKLEHEETTIKPETARIIRELLKASIAYNVGTRHMIAGNVSGLSIAGKTGTAEKHQSGGGYSKSATVASFVGFFPAENPKFITLVVIDDPKTDGGWGDTVAGPVFNSIAGYIRDLYPEASQKL